MSSLAWFSDRRSVLVGTSGMFGHSLTHLACLIECVFCNGRAVARSWSRPDQVVGGNGDTNCVGPDGRPSVGVPLVQSAEAPCITDLWSFGGSITGRGSPLGVSTPASAEEAMSSLISLCE